MLAYLFVYGLLMIVLLLLAVNAVMDLIARLIAKTIDIRKTTAKELSEDKPA